LGLGEPGQEERSKGSLHREHVDVDGCLASECFAMVNRCENA
jgi:hypothetical protein